MLIVRLGATKKTLTRVWRARVREILFVYISLCRRYMAFDLLFGPVASCRGSHPCLYSVAPLGLIAPLPFRGLHPRLYSTAPSGLSNHVVRK